MAENPPEPAMAPQLRVGVTGHRLDRLGGSVSPALMAVMEQVLAAVESAAGLELAGQLRLINCLADGADSLAADSALARGWSMDAVLPFARDDYGDDFAEGEARDLYVRRLAACAAVMELPGSRADAHGEMAAYERAGRVLLAQCDILIALWDGGPVRGRGGAAQIVAEAVHQGIAVVHIDPQAKHPPLLLWDGLEQLALGQDTVDTVAQGSLDDLPQLINQLVDRSGGAQQGGAQAQPRFTFAVAYPLLLMLAGVRRMRRSDFSGGGNEAGSHDEIARLCAQDQAVQGRLSALLAPRFARADAAASRIAQLFRHGYVANFSTAALAVVLSLLGLVLPASAKPVLIAAELTIIGAILWRTHHGNRAGWHRRWLDNRALAERLRCLAVSAQLGDLNLRGGAGQPDGWVASHCRAVSRAIGLPFARVDAAYLAGVQAALGQLVSGQIAYLAEEARRMHRLEHRLHRLGTWLFVATALACIGMLLFKLLGGMLPGHDALTHPAALAATIIGAALPALGAAIYGIRMQGDFAGSAERAADLAQRLGLLRSAIDEAASFDALNRCAKSATSLLTADVASWLHAANARPLALPG